MRLHRAVALDFQLRDLQRVVDRVPDHLAEDGVLPVDPVAALESDEELRAVRVSRSRVRHRDLAAVVELDPGVQLIFEGFAVDRVPALAGARGVAGLDAKVFDDSMEDAVLVVALQAQLDEVPARLRGFLRPELDLYLAMARREQHLPLGRRLELVHVRHRARRSGGAATDAEQK
eukprot:31270-Pelagococcus_subviridis.AAC.11